MKDIKVYYGTDSTGYGLKNNACFKTDKLANCTNRFGSQLE